MSKPGQKAFRGTTSSFALFAIIAVPALTAERSDEVRQPYLTMPLAPASVDFVAARAWTQAASPAAADMAVAGRDATRSANPMQDAEALLVGADPSFAASVQGRVVSRAGPDVVVIRTGLDEFPQLAKGARFAIARSADGEMRTLGDEKSLDSLDAGARLFVDAWRHGPSPKSQRKGEGLSWDAPGFEPPGNPTRRNR